jgi:hypothetical protein
VWIETIETESKNILWIKKFSPAYYRLGVVVVISVFCFGLFDLFPQDIPPQPLPANQSAMAESENQA